MSLSAFEPALERNGAAALKLAPRDLALIMAAIAIVSPLLQASALFNDADTLWHLHYGREWLRTGVFPWTDSDSYTARGLPWITKEWLSQVIMAAVQHVAGWSGLALLVAVCVGLSMLIIGLPIARRAPPLAAAFILAILPVFWASHLLARPHVLAFPVLALWVVLLARAADRLEAPHPAIALLMVLWANLHGGFTLGIALAAGLGAESVLHAPASRRAELAKGWALFLALTLAAALCTPFGPQSLLVTGKIFALGQHLTSIQEWTPFSFQSDKKPGLALLAGLGAMIYLRPRFRAARLALILFVLYLALTYSRNLELLALVLPTLVLGAVSTRLQGVGVTRAGTSADPRIAGAVAAGLTALAILTVWRGPEPTSRNQPAAALEFARRSGLDRQPVFNGYHFGGYLITQGVPTFIDGRAELFPSAVHDDYDRVMTPGGPKQLSTLDAYGVGWPLRPSESAALAPLERSGGWTRVYGDDIATILTRSGTGAAQQR